MQFYLYQERVLLFILSCTITLSYKKLIVNLNKMKFFSVLLVIMFAIQNGNTQVVAKNRYTKFTVGRVAFGTGDIFGYSFSTELSKDLNKHINIGAEATIENGKVQPTFLNVFRTFNQVSNIAITPKLNYYPFKKIGFNVGIGPTIGYQINSKESQYTILYDVNGNPYWRRSILQYNNNLFVGYRVSLNYDVFFKKGFVLGVRSDFSNYNNGDINNLLALKAGFRF